MADRLPSGIDPVDLVRRTVARVTLATVLIAIQAQAAPPLDSRRSVRDAVNGGRDALAESLAVAALASTERSTPADSLPIAAALEEVAYAMVYNGRHHQPRALDSAGMAVGICERRGAQAGALLGRCLLTLGRLELELDRPDAAIEFLERARVLGSLVDPSGEADSTRALFELGCALVEADRDSLGWAVLDRAREERLRLLGPNHVSLLGSAQATANRAWKDGRLDSSILIADRGLELGRRLLGPDHPALAGLLRRKAASLRFLGRFTEAAAAYDEALRVLEHSMRPDHPDLALTRVSAAVNLIRLSEYERVESHFEEAIPVIRTELGAETLDYARTLAAEGEYRVHMGDVGRARALLEESLTLHRRLGTTGSSLGAALRSLGSVLLWYGWPQEGRRCFEEALTIYERTYPPHHVEVGIAKLQMANALHMTGEFDRAEAMAREALAVFREIRPRTASEGDCLKRIGEIEISRGHLENAVRIFDEALAALEGVEGDGRFRAANALVQRGSAHQYAGHLVEARRDRELAIRALEDVYGPGHPQTYPVAYLLALVHEESGDRRTAFQITADVLDRQVPFMRRSLWQLPEQEALTYSQGLSSLVGTITALARDGGDSIPHGRTRAFDAVIRSRGLVLEETARRLHSMRQANTPELRQLQLEFERASRKLASLELRAGPSGEANPSSRAKLVEAARRERDSIERALGAMDPVYFPLVAKEEVGLAEVAAALPPGSAIVSYVTVHRGGLLDARVRFRKVPGNEHIPPPPFGPPRYAAFVLAAGDTVPSLVSLATTAEVDSLAAAWLQEVGTPPPASVEERHAAERRCRQAGERLRRAAWDPVRARVSMVERIFLVPDGALCAVSFEALPGRTREFLAEEPVVLHTLSAERDLVPAAGLPAERGAGLLAMGGADFDARSSDAPGSDSAPRHGSGAQPRARASGVYRGPSVPCAEFQSYDFVPIQGSLREVDDIAELWNRTKSRTENALVLSGSQASESAVKAMAPGRRILHLATHGFVLDGGCAELHRGDRGFGVWAPTSTPGPAKTKAKPSATPMFHSKSLLLSGLALAGANRRGRALPGEEDGILTAEEIAAMDLSGVEWVVVSACESGRGAVRIGEGVIGLRRSFQLAGARTTILSLWSVEDRATREWMRVLYEARLLRGRDTMECVRDASRAVLASRRANGRSTHPFYWGAFVAAGDWK